MMRPVGSFAFLLLTLCVGPPVAAAADADTRGRQILAETDVQGGLVVHLGATDPAVTLQLHANDSYVVHGLMATDQEVQQARAFLRRQGLTGALSFDRRPASRLPYADNVVNLVVAERLGNISIEEVQRVLCPGGVGYFLTPSGAQTFVKPIPKDTDEWTHFLYDATNNAVSKDTAVDLPYHLQWVGSPEFCRSHDHLASVSALVTSGGRIFYIADEGPTAAVALPAKWTLTARDAYNGVELWKKPLGVWEGHLRGFRTGPADLPRRLVASGDRVFVTLGYGEPLVCLDAATGDIVRTYAGTDGTHEILHDAGVLYLAIGETDVAEAARRRGESPPIRNKRIVAIEAETGEILWEKADHATSEMLPLTLTVGEDRVFFHNSAHLVCLDRGTGEELWNAARPVATTRWAWSTPTVVVYGDVVISADRAAPQGETEADVPQPIDWQVSSRGGEAPEGEMIAFSVQTGEELWRAPAKEAYNAPPDVLVVNGRVWSGELVKAREPGITKARDIETGEVVFKRPRDQEFYSFGFSHHRCYRNKATERFLLVGRSGVEFQDVTTGDVAVNHFIRGTCQYGVMPANGLLYVPPHSCACFIEAKLAGLNALAPKRYDVAVPSADDRDRLERGPAYDAAYPTSSSAGQWPTYRCDTARTGHAPQAVGTSLETAWRTRLGARLSSPVMAEGKIFVAAKEEHTIHAIDAATGQPSWSYTAGGRIDSPPTIYKGRALFGSADGYIYCLRASDGRLAWRLRAAPEDRRIVVYDQLESLWPVSGSVLVVDQEASESSEAVLYAAAGRTSYLDGGLFLYRIAAETGEILSVTCMNNRDAETDLPPQDDARGVNMPGALPDVLSYDGESIYMRHVRFNKQGEPQGADVKHLFSPAGFLDDSWWHRTYWIYATDMASGWGAWPQRGYQVPSGRLLVVGDDKIYGFGRLFQYATHGAHVGVPGPLLPWPNPNPNDLERGLIHYRLFASAIEPAMVDAPAVKAKKRFAVDWSEPLDVTVRAMVLAGETLFVAGPPERLAITPDTMATGRDLSEAQAAMAGRRGGLLWAVSPEDGSRLAEYELESPPVFDGLIAADGKLFAVLLDGSIVCMQP